MRRFRSRGYYYGHTRKSIGWCVGWLYRSARENRRVVAQSFSPVFIFKYISARDYRNLVKVLEMVQSEIGKKLRDTVKENSHYFREKMTALGFTLVPGEHAIIPVMLGDAKIATAMADKLLQEYIYVIGFSYPVVPMNKARIRVQLSAAHTKVQLDKAIAAFEKIGKMMGVI